MKTYYAFTFVNFKKYDIEKNIILAKLKELYDGDIDNIENDNLDKVDDLFKKVKKLKTFEQLNIISYVLDKWYKIEPSDFNIKLNDEKFNVSIVKWNETSDNPEYENKINEIFDIPSK